MNGFTKLGLKKDIVNILQGLGFKEPLSVQKEIIPRIIQGKNIAFTSMTGSGKTLAYSIPYLSKINTKLGVQMIVVIPTRELCIQVGKEIEKICERLNINVGTIYGGRDVKGDYRTTSKKNQIIIGTPGRLIKHINNKNIKVGEVKYIVFDECDQMFAEGFEQDCVYIRKRISKNSQLVLVSATITPKFRDFLKEQIPNHDLVIVGDIIPKDITKEKIFCEKVEKNDIIFKILKKKNPKRTIIFCNTRIKCFNISKFLNDNKYNAKALSGDFEQYERIQHLNMFKSGKVNVLVTTDVAARGLDVNNLDCVIEYDISKRPEFYVHRIGRTGRNEKKGFALSLVCPEDIERIEKIENIFNIKIKEVKIEDISK